MISATMSDVAGTSEQEGGLVRTVLTAAVISTVVLTPLVYLAQRKELPDEAVAQAISVAVAGVLGGAVGGLLTAWGSRQAERAARTAGGMAVVTLLLLPLAWWSPIPIVLGIASASLAAFAIDRGAGGTGSRVARVGGIVLAVIGAAAALGAAVVALAG